MGGVPFLFALPVFKAGDGGARVAGRSKVEAGTNLFRKLSRKLIGCGYFGMASKYWSRGISDA